MQFGIRNDDKPRNVDQIVDQLSSEGREFEFDLDAGHLDVGIEEGDDWGTAEEMEEEFGLANTGIDPVRDKLRFEW